MPKPNLERREQLVTLFPRKRFSHLPEYKVWTGMHRRCRTSPYYKGRVTVCDDWGDFLNFLADMGFRPSPSHSIDRIDNDGHYEPGNCRWATRPEQLNNRRKEARPSTKFVQWKGEERLLSDLCKEHGLNYQTVKQRIVTLGWDLERALTTPVQRRSAPGSKKRRDGRDDRPRPHYRSCIEHFWNREGPPPDNRRKKCG